MEHSICSLDLNRGKTGMKPYSALNHLPISGMIVLIAGSVITGLALGALAYFISNLFYLVVIFPVLVGFAGAILYQSVAFFSKVRHTWLPALIGCATGVLIAAAFYMTPYLRVRHDYVAAFQAEYGTDALTASEAFDTVLTYETGSSGFWGFMKFRAAEGDQYTNYLVVNSLPVSEFSFTLQSTWAWLYWMLEVILFALPLTWIGVEAGKGDFNLSANDWYAPLAKQIGSVSLENKEELLARLHASELLAVSELLQPEGEIPHPALEIYEQRSKNKGGDILLSVKQTARVSSSKVSRKTVGKWEISPAEYAPFAEAVKRMSTGDLLD